MDWPGVGSTAFVVTARQRQVRKPFDRILQWYSSMAEWSPIVCAVCPAVRGVSSAASETAAHLCCDTISREVGKSGWIIIIFIVCLVRFCVYIGLNDQDSDLLGSATAEKTREIASRTGILGYLPGGLDLVWPSHGKLLMPESRKLWDSVTKPIVIKGHNLWTM